jgi:hypothetical protein
MSRISPVVTPPGVIGTIVRFAGRVHRVIGEITRVWPMKSTDCDV